MKKQRGPSLASKTSGNLSTKVSLIYHEVEEPKERLKEFWDMKPVEGVGNQEKKPGDQYIHGS